MFIESYDYGINGNYMILDDSEGGSPGTAPGEDSGENGTESGSENRDASTGYIPRMLVENHIPSFLECSIIHSDGRERYIYDITSRTSVTDMYEHTRMDHRFLLSFIDAVASVLENAEEYLLPCEHIIFDPGYIYVDRGTDMISWCYYPGHFSELNKSMTTLAEYILERADHTNRDTVNLAYDFYKQVINGDYSLRRLTVRSETESAAAKEEEKENYLIEDDSDFYLPDEDEEPVIPASGKIILGVCIFVLVVISGVILASALYSNLVLSILLGMREMQVFLGLSGALSLFMPTIILVKWFNKVRDFRKKLEDSKAGISDIYHEMEYAEYAGNTGRLAAPDRNENPDRIFMRDQERTEAINKKSGTMKLNTDDQDGVNIHRDDTMRQNCCLHRLVQITGDGINELKIGKLPFIIGKRKSVCDAVLASDAVSRVHAKLFLENGAYYVSDLNSTNGTFVNGSRLRANEKKRLTDNDEIRFGKELFYFR